MNIDEIKPEDHFARIDEDGVFRVYNMRTYEVVLEKHPLKCSKDFKNKFLPAPTLKLKKYHPFIGDLIVEKILEGCTLSEISKLDKYPEYRVMMRWLIESDDFLMKVKRAEVIRSRYYHDKIIAMAEDEKKLDSDGVRQAKLKMEAFKWAASVGDGEKFGNKTQVSADISTTTTLIIETGIRRDPLTEQEKRIIDAVPTADKDNKGNNKERKQVGFKGDNDKNGDGG